MEGIIHIRIDDRLIHGQVATQWTNDLGATRIMAINDEVATNPTLKTVLRMAAPPNVSTSIITRETAVTNIKAGKYTGQKVLVVVKSPFDILYLIDQGLDIKTVNVGNMSARENTEHLRPTISVTPEEKEAFKVCQEKIKKHNLEMKLIDAEYTFDNNKVLFYFTADGRIDFRQLVKDLASIFKTRIELRQIGVRDETKILGGIGICGRCLCCHTYLSEFAPVSIKMAKEQNLSLNQTKISGVCGRLMCCLKNEQETYEELNKNLPGTGDTVTLPDGLQGTVHSVNVLRQRVKVIVEVNDEKEIQEFSVNELKFRPRKKKAKAFEREGKETKESEQKEGDSKSHGKKSAE